MKTETPTFEVERRCIQAKNLEVRAAGEGSKMPTLVGYAAIYDSPSDLGPFIETIAGGAFGESISRGDDIRALFNHDTAHVLGRRSVGTLRIFDEAKGVRVEIDLPNTQTARDLSESIDRGDIDQMSVTWYLDENFESEWRWLEETGEEKDMRRILRATLREVSVVAIPAYDDTSIAKRSLKAARSEQKPEKKISAEERQESNAPVPSREVLMARRKTQTRKRKIQ